MANKNETVKEIATRIAEKVADKKAVEALQNYTKQYMEKLDEQIKKGKVEHATNTIATTNQIVSQQYPESGFISVLTKTGEISLPYNDDTTFSFKLNREGKDLVEELVYTATDFSVLDLRELLNKIKEYDYCEILSDTIKPITKYDEKKFEETMNLEDCKYQTNYHRQFFGFCKTEDLVSVYKNVAFFE